MSSRDAILAAIRANKPAPSPLPDVPFFGDGADDDRLAGFSAAFKSMGGVMLAGIEGDPLAGLRERLTTIEGDVVSTAPEVTGTRIIDDETVPSSLHDVDTAVVRAAFGIAETGSVALTEAELRVNTLAYLAQHLIVLLDPADIVVNLHHAYQRPEFTAARYTVFHTGPSATADIEGVLVHGAQGVRSLSVLPLARS